ncbi:MAG: ABC transporter permease [Dehalococcoidia bacterium]
MRQYIAKRLLAMIPVLLGVSLLTFLIVRIIPGDMATIILGEDASPAELAALRDKLGLNRPLLVQYADWLGGLVRGDLGVSERTGLAVGPEIASRLPVTIELTLLAMLVSFAIAIPAGVVSAMRQDTWADYGVRLFSIGGLSIPEFWTGILLLVIPVIWFGWAPNLSYVPLWQNPAANLQQFMLPALAMGVSLSALVMRMTRSALLDVLRQDYIRTANAKGLRERTVVVRHALKNAFIPVVTILGLQLGRLLGGALS